MESCLNLPWRPTSSQSVPSERSDPALILFSLRELKSWMDEIAEIGSAGFGEFAQRLELLRDQVRRARTNPEPAQGVVGEHSRSQEPSLSAAQANQIREDILHSLDRLITRLRCEETCFVTWQEACRSFDSIRPLIESLGNSLQSRVPTG